MIEIEVEGTRYTGFTSIEVVRSIEHSSGTFTFTATNQDVKTFPLKVNQKCIVYVDQEPLISGFIESLTASYDFESHNITIAGRDKTADIIDSYIGSQITFDSEVTLKTITEKILSVLNISDIKVIEEVEIKHFSKGDIQSAEIGQNAFDFIQSLCKKRQVLTTTDGKGNFVFTRASKTLVNTILKPRE